MRTTMAGMMVLAMGAGGCGEHWHAHDDQSIRYEGPSQVLVEVFASPDAFPDKLYGEAVRVSVDEAHHVRLVDGEGAVRLDDYSVNVLDALRGCEPGVDCQLAFTFQVGCNGDEVCKGMFEADAFLSTHPRPERGSGGEFELSLSLVE